MPFGDRTGPLGLGPRTGRGMGYCSGYPAPGSMSPLLGRGWLGSGRGRGSCFFGRARGRRNWYWVTGMSNWARSGYEYPPYGPDFTPKEEVDILKDQAEFLKQQLDDIQDRISKLEKTQVKESE